MSKTNPFLGYPRSTARPTFYIEDLGTAGFFGIQFIDTAEDRIIANQNLTTKPNIVIKGSTMVIDYSDSGSNRDKDFIDIAFTSMTAGHGFTLSNANYNDVVNDYTADLSASCTLTGYKNYKILSTFSAIGSTTETNYYQSNNFETVPQIGITAGLTSGITFNQLINYTTSSDTSFISNEFSIGDYVDLSTSSNTGRYTISGITVDGFSREIVAFREEFVPPITPENLIGTEVVVGHKRKVYMSDSNPTTTDVIVHMVNTREFGGGVYFTIDGTTQKELTLYRGVLYVFVEESYPQYTFNFSSEPDNNTSYSDLGIYSVLDNSLNKRLTFIVPNNITPDNLYYTDSSRAYMGGPIRITGNYTYSSNSPTLSLSSTITTSDATTTSVTTY